jgi:glycine betaine/proline transport system permease protein
VLIALPLGMWAGRSDTVQRVLRPFLDIAQVLPQFVYLIPVVFLFSIGRAAGVVACVIYAVPAVHPPHRARYARGAVRAP